MTPKSVQLHLGATACFISLFLIFIGIPKGVSSPSNVPNIVLSPLFWPYVLASFTGLAGLGLLMAGWRQSGTDTFDDEPENDTNRWLRLGALALLMVVTMYALPRLGMVWTTMLVFVFTAFLFRTRHPRTAMICAVLIPLGLYLFFAHVAGVGIPQGNYVRLP